MSDEIDVYISEIAAAAPVSFTVRFIPSVAPSETCTAAPCPVCLGCVVCRDFHGFGSGCTPDTCPSRTGGDA